MCAETEELGCCTRWGGDAEDFRCTYVVRVLRWRTRPWPRLSSVGQELRGCVTPGTRVGLPPCGLEARDAGGIGVAVDRGAAAMSDAVWCWRRHADRRRSALARLVEELVGSSRGRVVGVEGSEATAADDGTGASSGADGLPPTNHGGAGQRVPRPLGLGARCGDADALLVDGDADLPRWIECLEDLGGAVAAGAVAFGFECAGAGVVVGE